MELENLLYLEIDMIGIAILLIILYFLGKNHQDSKKVNSHFISMVICNIAVLPTDTVTYFSGNLKTPAALLVTTSLYIAYFLLHAVFGLCWLRFCLEKLFPDSRLSPLWNFVFYVPIAASAVLVGASPFTGWVYSVTAQDGYQRGPLMLLLMVPIYFYLCISTVIVIREWAHETRPRERSLYTTLLFFPILTILGCLLQMLVYGLSIIWICTAVSLLILLINLQHSQLSRDILTGLFNRRQTNLHLSYQMAHDDGDGRLFVIIADVDHFKKINDRFGHIIGDRALVEAAGVLRKSCHEKDFLARFGGDEFIIIGHAQDTAEIDARLAAISAGFSSHTCEKTDGYPLTMSCGYAVWDKAQQKDIDSLIALADKEMYKVKYKKHTEAMQSNER